MVEPVWNAAIAHPPTHQCGERKKTPSMADGAQRESRSSLRGHYPDQVRRSVTVRPPSQPGSPSSRCGAVRLWAKPTSALDIPSSRWSTRDAHDDGKTSRPGVRVSSLHVLLGEGCRDESSAGVFPSAWQSPRLRGRVHTASCEQVDSRRVGPAHVPLPVGRAASRQLSNRSWEQQTSHDGPAAHPR